MKRRYQTVYILFFAILMLQGCAAIQEARNAVMNMRRLQFKLDGVAPGALAVAGKSGSASRITLSAIPTVTVAGFPLKYPNELEIIDKEFTDK